MNYEQLSKNLRERARLAATVWFSNELSDAADVVARAGELTNLLDLAIDAKEKAQKERDDARAALRQALNERDSFEVNLEDARAELSRLKEAPGDEDLAKLIADLEHPVMGARHATECRRQVTKALRQIPALRAQVAEYEARLSRLKEAPGAEAVEELTAQLTHWAVLARNVGADERAKTAADSAKALRQIPALRAQVADYEARMSRIRAALDNLKQWGAEARKETP